MKTNWNKGLHRLFIIGVVCWFVYILLVYPINIIQKRQSSSLNLLSLEESMVYDIENNNERERMLSDIDRKRIEIFEDHNIQSFYKTEYFNDIPIFLAILFIPPIFIYLSFRFFIFLIFWIKNGFSN